MSILRTAAALAAALTLSTAFAAPPPEVVELEGQWRGRLCTAEGNPTKTNLSIDKYGCFVLFQTDVNGAAQSAGTVTVKEGVMTLVDAKTGPYMVLKAASCRTSAASSRRTAATSSAADPSAPPHSKPRPLRARGFCTFSVRRTRRPLHREYFASRPDRA